MGDIYMIFNNFNDKVYIGKAKNGAEDRWKDHIGYDLQNNQYIHRAMRKYGIKNFQYKILESNISEERLNEREKYWIAYYQSQVPNGYNETSGGDGGTGEGLIKWRKENAELASAISRKTIQKALEWRENNPDKTKEINEKWRAAGQEATRKKVQMINKDTDEVLHIFNSLTEAAHYLNKNRHTNISACANGKTKTAYGYKWKFV